MDTVYTVLAYIGVYYLVSDLVFLLIWLFNKPLWRKIRDILDENK